MARIKVDPAEAFSYAALKGNPCYILGCDPAQDFGYAAMELRDGVGKLLDSGTWRLNVSKQHCSRGAMLIRLDGELQRILRTMQQMGLVLVAYESTRFYRSVGQVQSSASITSHLQLVCEVLSVPFINLEPSEVKKWSTGKGNADKLTVRKAMIKVFGEKLKKGKRSEDEFDAMAAAYAQARKAGWWV